MADPIVPSNCFLVFPALFAHGLLVLPIGSARLGPAHPARPARLARPHPARPVKTIEQLIAT